MILETSRVRLRRFVEADLGQVEAALADSDAGLSTTPYWKPLSHAELRHHLGIDEREGTFKFAVCLKADLSCPIGIADMNKVDLRQGTAEPGISLWGTSSRGAKLGRSALWLVCRWGFDALRLERLSARIIASNLPALRNTEAIGFVREGLMRNHLLLAGERHDLVILGASRPELLAYDPYELPWEIDQHRP